DAVELHRREDVFTSPRFRTLTGTQIYDTSATNAAGGDLTNPTSQNYRNQDGTVPSWAEWVTQSTVAGTPFGIINLFHSTNAAVSPANSFGNDYIAGGGGNDMILGQLGDDTIQGDGAIEGKLLGTPVGASRAADNSLVLVPSFETASD